jgi:hypothetical protein
MATKGQRIRFVGGKYGGKKGWINLEKPAGEETTPVIVNLKKKGEKATYVYNYSFEIESTTEPSSYAGAVLQQCPDLDCALTKLCRDFAKCSIFRDYPGFAAILDRKMQDATELMESRGSRGLYRHIKFDSTGMRS